MMLSEFDEKKVPALFDSEMGIPVFHVEKENRKQNHSGEMRHATFFVRSSAGALVVRCGHLAGEVYGPRIQSP